MPNLCTTSITLTNDDTLNNFYNLLKKWTDGCSELSNIVRKANLGDVKCRGDVSHYSLEKDGTALSIETETAWVPMLRMWQMLRDKFCPTAALYYHAAECGMDLFYTNDPNMIDTYYLDAEEIGFGFYDSITKEKAVEILQEILKADTSNNLEELSEMIEDAGLGCYIHKWRYASACEWD